MRASVLVGGVVILGNVLSPAEYSRLGARGLSRSLGLPDPLKSPAFSAS